MAQIFNGQRVRGVRVLDEGATLYNGQRVIGVRAADEGMLFGGGLRTAGVDVLADDRLIWNDQRVIGVVLITDNRQIYNGRQVLPAWALTGSLGGNALQPFYDSDTIGIHLRREGGTPAGGPVTAIANEGGAGSLFNSTVVGTPIGLTGNYLEATASSGYPQTANPADLIGVRLIWVMRTNVATGTYRFFGRSDGSTSSYVRTLSGTSLQLNSNVTGTSVTITTPTFAASAAPRIFELEMTATEARLWVNGTSLGPTSHPWDMFRVDRLTQGPTTLQAFEGGMGDVLGVVTGQPDTDAAIATARYYLDQRYGLGVGFTQPVAPALSGGSLEVS